MIWLFVFFAVEPKVDGVWAQTSTDVGRTAISYGVSRGHEYRLFGLAHLLPQDLCEQ